MRTAEAEGTLRFGTDFEEKTWCRLTVIPVLVFDCVALQAKKGTSSLISMRGGSESDAETQFEGKCQLNSDSAIDVDFFRLI